MPLSIRLCSLGLLAALAGCAGGGRQAEVPASPTRVADAALASGNAMMALQVLSNTLKANPRDIEALQRQGQAQALLGQRYAAEGSFHRVVALDPGNRVALLGLAKLALAEHPADAERQFDVLAAADANNTDALVDLGVARDMQGHHSAAQDAYRRALAIAPDLASAQQDLGLSLAMSGQAAKGVQVLGAVAGDGGGDRRARDNLALALTLNGRTAEAGRVLREELNAADAKAALDGYQALSEP